MPEQSTVHRGDGWQQEGTTEEQEALEEDSPPDSGEVDPSPIATGPHNEFPAEDARYAEAPEATASGGSPFIKHYRIIEFTEFINL